uniref:Uncharacterized protein n=1 Tax=Oryza brachyantha TaxID=4533 RepID=J3MK31_ORYBR
PPVQGGAGGVQAGGRGAQPDGHAVVAVLRRAGLGRPAVPVPVQGLRRRPRVDEVVRRRPQPRHDAAGQVRPHLAGALLIYRPVVTSAIQENRWCYKLGSWLLTANAGFQYIILSPTIIL